MRGRRRFQSTYGFVLLLCVVMEVLSIESAAAAQAANVLRGTVVARETGRPIAGATVTVEGSNVTVTTNALGRFELPAPAGQAPLVVSAPGYLPTNLAGVQSQALQTIELERTPNFLDAVQVTATKGPSSVGDVAAPATIVDRETIERRGDQRLIDVVEHVPGAFITTELGVFESVLFRGMPRVGNEFTNTLLLIDGVPQTNSGNEARVVALPINDASSVEVVRGPNSALYGRTAIGGAINVITADPTTHPELKVDLTGGQFDTAKGVVAASGPIREWGGYYASVGKERSGSYFQEPGRHRLRNRQYGVLRQAEVRARRTVVRLRHREPRVFRQQHANQRTGYRWTAASRARPAVRAVHERQHPWTELPSRRNTPRVQLQPPADKLGTRCRNIRLCATCS